MHRVDLDGGVTFVDAPTDALTALVDDVLAMFASRVQLPDVTIEATDVPRTWGSGASRVDDPVAAIAAWQSRSRTDGLTGDVPALPAWL